MSTSRPPINPHEQWVICDIDGTLANIEHRLSLIKQDKPDWDAFNRACTYDTPVPSTLAILRLIAKEPNWRIAFSTGRTRKIESETRWWLQTNGIPCHMLMMRPEGDYRSDTIIKTEHYNTQLCRRNVAFVLEDRDKCVEMWRSFGLVCWQVRRGDY